MAIFPLIFQRRFVNLLRWILFAKLMFSTYNVVLCRVKMNQVQREQTVITRLINEPLKLKPLDEILSHVEYKFKNYLLKDLIQPVSNPGSY